MTRAEAKQRLLATVVDATNSRGFSEAAGQADAIVVTNGNWWARATLLWRNGEVDIVGPVQIQRTPFRGVARA